MSMSRSRWAAVGAAVAVTLGAGGIGIVDATKGSGERAVYTAIEPCRLVDTRPNFGIGGRTSPLGPDEVYPLTAHGDNGECTGIPTDAVALELNVTGLQNTGATHFTIWDGAGPVPNASHVNLAAGASATPNSVTTELDGDGFAIRNNSATAHVVIDIVGVYQDHHHDDRYYTEAEIDAMLNPPSILLTAGDLRGSGDWSTNRFGAQRSAGVSNQCAYAPVDIRPGRVISSFDVRYVAQDIDVEVRLTQDDFTEGFIGVPETISSGVQTLDGVGANEFYYGLDNLPVTGPATVQAGLQQLVEICSSSALIVNAVRVNFAD